MITLKDSATRTYWLTWNSGEMLQAVGATTNAILTISNMTALNGDPLDTPYQAFKGIGVLPTANSIVCAAPSNPTGVNPVPFTVTFSEPVKYDVGNASSFDFTDLVVTKPSGLTYTTVQFSGGPQVYTVSFTGVAGNGTFTLGFVSNPSIQDLAGNPLVTPVSLSASVGIDQVKPNVVSVTCPDPTSSPVFTVTFDKDVLGFNDPATDLFISKGASSTLDWTGVTIAGGPRVYTVNFQGVVGGGPLTLGVRGDSDIHDVAQNVLVSTGNTLTVVVDTEPPRATIITAPNPGPTSATSISFLVHFDSPVYGLAPSDLLVSGAGVNHTGAQITAGTDGDTDYSVQITGVSGSGVMTLQIKTGTQASVHDLAGNKLYSSAISNGVTIDNTGPRATAIISLSGNYVQGGTIPFSVIFDEGVKQFDNPNDLVITTSSGVTYAGTAITGGPQIWTVYVAGISGQDGTLTLAVSTKSNVCDLSNNAILSSVTSAPLNVDITRPLATVTPVTPSPTRSSTVVFSVHFSEPVQNFTDSADLAFAETGTVAHVGGLITGGPQDYTVTAAGVNGTGTIALAVNALSDVKDIAGNSLDSSGTSSPVVIDNTAPAVTVTPLITKSQTPALSGAMGDNIAVATVSVTVNGLVHAATLDQGTGTWSVAWPDTLPQGVYDVLATATDTVGNSAGDTTTSELTVDTTPPAVTVNSQITGNRTPFVSGTVSDSTGVSAVTFTVNGFTYTATVSGGAWNGHVTDQLPAINQSYDVQATATDTAGNTGQDATTNELTYDSNVPTVLVNTLFTNNSTPTLSGSVSFMPPATGITSLSVVVHGITYSTTLAPPVDNAQTWTANVTEVLPEGIYDVVAHAVDSAARPGSDGSTHELTIDKQGPTATFALLEGAPTSADVIHVTVTFSEPLLLPLDSTGVALSGTLQGAAAVTGVSGVDPAYTVEITMNDPKDDGTIGIQINPTVTDRASNSYVGVASPEWVINNFDITGHPQNARAYSGEQHTFHLLAAFGNNTPVYAWKWNNGAKAIQDVGTDSPDLVIPDVTGKAGAYWCEVTYGGITYPSNKATLSVAPPPSIVQGPQDAARLVGERCDFSVVAEGGFPPLAYEWWKDGVRIGDAAGNSLSIARVEWSDAGTYQVIVTDVQGTPVQSGPAVLTVTGQLVPAVGLAGMAALAGAIALMGCRSKLGRRK